VRRAIAAAALAVALLAGCGGAGEPKTVSKERFVAEGDNVCASLSDRFASAGATDPNTPAEVAKSADVLADVYGDLRERLSDIRLPTDPVQRRGAAAYVAAVRRTGPLLARLRAAARRFVAAAAADDGQQLAQAGVAVRSALDAFRAGQAQADRRALDYGFEYCGNLS
jgi:hypothetical protein